MCHLMLLALRYSVIDLKDYYDYFKYIYINRVLVWFNIQLYSTNDKIKNFNQTKCF